MATITLTVSGMTCGHCVAKVEAALKGVKGVFGASVDLEGGMAEVDFDETRTSPDDLADAVMRAGYGAKVAA